MGGGSVHNGLRLPQQLSQVHERNSGSALWQEQVGHLLHSQGLADLKWLPVRICWGL